MEWDHTVDLLVVGSGNGAMTAAICAHDMGIKDVLVIEKGKQFGGTSSLSGGGVWVPNNRYAKAAGAKDSFDDAREYLRNTIPEGMVPDSMIDTYLENAPKMIDYMHEHTRLRYVTLEKYPDYYTDLPGAREGHRSLEPEEINMDELGEDEHKILPGTLYMFEKIAISQVDAQVIVGRLKGWLRLALKLAWNYYTDFSWRKNHTRTRRTTCGAAGIIRLYLSLKDREVPLWLDTELTELIREDGRITGAVVKQNGNTLRIKANKAVFLAAGGFEKNQEMREKYLPQPTNTDWSAGCKTNTGDAIRSAMDIGAKTALMDNAWWCTTLSIPGREYPFLSIVTKSFPGNISVNQRGERFSNESQNYMAFLKETFAKHTEETPCSPMYMIFDNDFKRYYPVYPLMGPNKWLDQQYFDSGLLAIDDTIAGLAKKLGMDPSVLGDTVSRFNGFAETGKDLDYKRGDVAYDRYYGDPRAQPNPCLGSISKPPYYAMRMSPGDFGTQGGIVINENSQVMNEDNEPIPGLYASGNCTAAVLPTYPGPGSTLGPAMTFAYQAAKHMTEWKED